MPFKDDRADGLYALLYDTLIRHGHRPGLHLTGDQLGRGRAWLNAAGFGALGHSIDDAARLYVQAGGSLASDPALREELRRLDEMLAV
ncbi:MAG: hypothetical protein QOE86_640 [Solirubrobacteraceae bacterium]|jgi:hypothetical protein|nr:hypothetical protein [Solirubrobacteraceae bacterium]